MLDESEVILAPPSFNIDADENRASAVADNRSPESDAAAAASSVLADADDDGEWKERHLRTLQMFAAFKEEHERWMSEHQAKKNRVTIAFEAVMSQRRKRLSNICVSGGASVVDDDSDRTPALLLSSAIVAVDSVTDRSDGQETVQLRHAVG